MGEVIAEKISDKGIKRLIFISIKCVLWVIAVCYGTHQILTAMDELQDPYIR